MKLHTISRKVITLLLVSLLTVTLSACKTESIGQTSTGTCEPVTDNSFSLSSVTPEVFWLTINEVYISEGPGVALLLIEEGINSGVVTQLEANQERAKYLFELGLVTDAFNSLVLYEIDANRPDLLHLRGDVVWTMGRYDEAKSHYEALLLSQGDEPTTDILYKLAMLYDAVGEWDMAEDARDKLISRPGDLYTLQLALTDAISSEDINAIKDAKQAWSESESDNATGDILVTIADIYISRLEGDLAEADRIARAFNEEHGFNFNITMLILNLDAESGDYGSFETDIQDALAQLNATEWLDASGSTWPDQPLDTANILSAASALELGRGNREKARLIAERAIQLNPFNYNANLQLAAVEMTEWDLEESFEYLEKARKLAPPSDLRTRLRIIQFSYLSEIGFNFEGGIDGITDELRATLDYVESKYPENAFNRSVRAELAGFEGDLETALRIYEEACDLPGATREMHYRMAYFLARLDRLDEAWETFESFVPAGAPYLPWASSLEQDARLHPSESLTTFATRVRNHLDPTNKYADYFAPPTEE